MGKTKLIGSSAWIVGGAGLLIGAISVWLVTQGNPGNMGLCIACFTRDIASVFGGASFNMGGTAYIRPEILGLILAAGVSAFGFREFKPRGGSSPFLRFVLGFIFIVAALIFLGCTVRAWMRLGAGDLNALWGVAGIVVGVVIGVFFLKRGFNLGRATRKSGAGRALGFATLAAVAALLVLAVLLQSGTSVPGLTVTAAGAKSTAEGAVIVGEKVKKPEGAAFQDGAIVAADGTVVSSAESVAAAKPLPGGSRAPLVISLAAGAVMGLVAQRSRFCTVGGIRDVLLVRRFDLLFGVIGVLVGVFVVSNVAGTFKLGFEGQPVAHTVAAANFLSMVVAALSAVLLGGCPLRQMVMSAEGDVDAGAAVLGMVAGALFAHYFKINASGAGVNPQAWWALAIMGVLLLGLGFWKSTEFATARSGALRGDASA
jgi:hypothetical protein